MCDANMADESPLLESSSSSGAPSVRKILSVKATSAGDDATTCEAVGHFLIRAMGWFPLVLSLAGDGLLAYTAAFVAAWFNVLCLTLTWYEMGKTYSWPKTLDIIFIIINGIFTMLTWYQHTIPVNLAMDSIISGGLVVGVCVAWALGYPFIRSQVAEGVDEEGLDHPILKHFIRRSTAIWIFIFSFMALVAFIPSIIDVKGDVSSTVETTCLVLVYILLALGICISYWIYPAYFDKHIDEIVDMYPKEIDMWNAEHPDHEYAQKEDEEEEITNVY